MLFITVAVILTALFQVAVADDPKINTIAGVVECQPVQFTWQGGAPPYYLSLIPGGQPSAPALRQFPVQNGNVMTWKVDLPTGSTFSSVLRDSTGAQAFSDIQTVQAGVDSSCLSGSGAATSPPSGSVSSTDSPAATTNTATTAAGTGSSTSHGTMTASSGSSGSGSATPIHVATTGTASPTSSSNAGSLQASAGAIGIAGLLGLAGAALLG